MKIGFYTWGSCFLPDPGLGGMDPYARDHHAHDFERAYKALLDWAKLADGLGYESFWVTEHHLQREGYEVIPNVVLLASVFAQQTKRIKFGSFFQVVPTWHPLRLAEDFAMADLLTGGRVVLGAGRGSVQREALTFNAGFGREGDEGDQMNRELFEEQMEIVRLALREPEFAFHGKYYDLPPAGILNTGNKDTGRPWDKISLVPKPLRPISIYQSCNSDDTFRYAARHGHTAVITTFGGLERTKSRWDWYGEMLQEHHGRAFAPGEKRMLVISVHLGDDREAALRELAPALTERNRFLALQRQVGTGADGKPLPVGYVPSVHESVARGNMLVGPPSEVAERLAEIVDLLGAEELAIEMGFPGMVEEQVANQIRRFAAEVRPRLERGERVAPPVEAAEHTPALVDA